MSHPSHYFQFDHPNNIWWAVQIITLFTMYFSSPTPPPCYFVPRLGEHKSWSSTMCNIFHSPATPSLYVPTTWPCTLCCSLNMNGGSHSQNTVNTISPLSTPWRHTRTVEARLHSFLISTLHGGECLTECSVRFTSGQQQQQHLYTLDRRFCGP